MGINREKAQSIFENYESVKRRIIALQDIVRNPDFVTEELAIEMRQDVGEKTQSITDELAALQKEIELLLQDVKPDKKPTPKAVVTNQGELVKLVVDCAENNRVDIACGGPHMLGFDFYVEQSESESLKEVIKVLLAQYGRPLLSISTVPCILGQKYTVWCKDSIEDAIKEGY